MAGYCEEIWEHAKQVGKKHKHKQGEYKYSVISEVDWLSDIKRITRIIIITGNTFFFFKNFNPQNESGEAFTFESQNFWSFMSAVIRASENKKFAYDWRILKKNLGKIEQI